jgi:hypothetical protein
MPSITRSSMGRVLFERSKPNFLQNGIFSNFICLPEGHQATYRKCDFAGTTDPGSRFANLK